MYNQQNINYWGENMPNNQNVNFASARIRRTTYKQLKQLALDLNTPLTKLFDKLLDAHKATIAGGNQK